MSTCAPLSALLPLSASNTLILSASGTPSCAAPALLVAEEVFARTSERRSSSSIQYGPSVIDGVSAAVAAPAFSVASAPSACGKPRRARKIEAPAEPASPSAFRLVIVSIGLRSFAFGFAPSLRPNPWKNLNVRCGSAVRIRRRWEAATRSPCPAQLTLEVVRPEDALAHVPAAGGNALRPLVLDRDQELEPLHAKLRERPLREQAERVRCDTTAARFRRADVAELRRARGQIDLRRHRDADEPPAVALDD